jgi:hypothetical protein
VDASNYTTVAREARKFVTARRHLQVCDTHARRPFKARQWQGSAINACVLPGIAQPKVSIRSKRQQGKSLEKPAHCLPGSLSVFRARAAIQLAL